MNRLTRILFFLAVFLGPAVSLFGNEVCYPLMPLTQRIPTTFSRPVTLIEHQPIPVYPQGSVLTTVWEPLPVDNRGVSAVFKPLRVAEGVVFTEELPPRPLIRPVADLVARETVLRQEIVEIPAPLLPFEPLRPLMERPASESLPPPTTTSTAVHKLAIPLSAPAPDEEPELLPSVLIPPPPMSVNDTPLSPFVPEPPSTLRGQSPEFRDALDEAMSVRPPLPQGPIGDPSAIPEPLTRLPSVVESTAKAAENDPVVGELKAKKLTSGVLLIVTLVSLGSLFYFVAIALDYRQRWMQSLISQNNRLMPGFDDTVVGGYGYHDDMDFYAGPRFQSFGTDPMGR